MRFWEKLLQDSVLLHKDQQQFQNKLQRNEILFYRSFSYWELNLKRKVEMNEINQRIGTVQLGKDLIGVPVVHQKKFLWIKWYSETSQLELDNSLLLAFAEK